MPCFVTNLSGNGMPLTGAGEENNIDIQAFQRGSVGLRCDCSATDCSQVEVHGAGRLLMFSNKAPCRCVLDTKEIDFEYDNEASTLVVTLPYARGLNHNLVVMI